MTGPEFFEFLRSNIDQPSVITLAPGPWMLKVSLDDKHAADLVLQLYEVMSDTDRVDKAENILLNGALKRFGDHLKADVPLEECWHQTDVRAFLYAWWWIVFWAAQEIPPDKPELEKRVGELGER
jgi:hypothetical protein